MGCALCVEDLGVGHGFGDGGRGCLGEEDIDLGGGGFVDGGLDGGVVFVAGWDGCAVGGEDLGECAGFGCKERRKAGGVFVEEEDVHLCIVIVIEGNG